MTLHVGENFIYSIYHGSDRIHKIYKGDDLVWQTYKTNQVVFENSESGDYEINLLTRGYYDVIVVGAGGGGCGNGAKGSSYSGCSGAAGGSFQGRIFVPRGKLILKIGKGGTKTGSGDYQGARAGTGGESSIYFGNNDIVTCSGGTGGRAYFRGHYSLGTGGSVAQGSYIEEVYESKTGSNGTGGNGNYTYYYCESPIQDLQYGAGGFGMGGSSGYTWDASDGENGYIKIVFISELR